VASLLVDLTDKLQLFESQTFDSKNLVNEIKEARPDLILLEESAPFSNKSLLIHLLTHVPDLPVIVISEDSNTMHIIRRETRSLGSSNDLIEMIHII